MSNIKLFESKQIRSIWNDEEQKWFFSIIDVIEILTQGDLEWFKRKLNKEGFNQLYENIVQLIDDINRIVNIIKIA